MFIAGVFLHFSPRTSSHVLPSPKMVTGRNGSNGSNGSQAAEVVGPGTG